MKINCGKGSHVYSSQIFDYIVELHELLWRVVNVVSPGASGQLDNYLPDAIDRLEAQRCPQDTRPHISTPEKQP